MHAHAAVRAAHRHQGVGGTRLARIALQLVLGTTLTTGISSCALWRYQAPAPPELAFQSVTLQQLDCMRGDCANYSINIDERGQVRYHGRRNVAVLGYSTGRANPAALLRLRRLLATPEFYWMPERFVPTHAGCGNWTPNEATVIIEVKSAHLDKRIVHYRGCRSAPALLTRIENAINAAADFSAASITPSSPLPPAP